MAAANKNRQDIATYRKGSTVSKTRDTVALPPLLDRLIYAARKHGDRDRAAALGALGQLAVVALPCHGVFAPADEEALYSAIEGVAARHLQFARIRKRRRTALEAITSIEKRDAVETACSEFQSVSDSVYFYAGLAFGIVLADYGR